MYRHFAAITIAITAAIALLVDGERRQAIGAELEAQREKQNLRDIEASKAKSYNIATQAIRYEPHSGGSDDTPGNPMNDAQGIAPMISDADRNGSAREAAIGDYGRWEPPGLREITSTGQSGMKTGALPQSRQRKPVESELESLDQAARNRAGQPTT